MVTISHGICQCLCKVTIFLHKAAYIIFKNEHEEIKKENNHKLFSFALQDGLEPTTP